MIDGACPSNVLPSEDLSDMQTLLLEAYRHIGEPDSVYGACSTHVAKDTTRLLLYEHEGDWHKSLSELGKGGCGVTRNRGLAVLPGRQAGRRGLDSSLSLT